MIIEELILKIAQITFNFVQVNAEFIQNTRLTPIKAACGKKQPDNAKIKGDTLIYRNIYA